MTGQADPLELSCRIFENSYLSCSERARKGTTIRIDHPPILLYSIEERSIGYTFILIEFYEYVKMF